MEQQKVEFSLSYFLKYALRYVLVIVFCAAIGLGLGAMMAAKEEPVTLKKYTGELIIDARSYAEAMNPTDPLSEADFNFYARKILQVYETAKSPEVRTKTFNVHKMTMYGSMQTEEARVDSFNADLKVTLVNDVLRVSFLHDAVSDAEHAAAQAVVNDYLAFAKENVLLKHPEFAGAGMENVISITPAYEDSEFLSESLEQLSDTPSILLYALVGAVAGAILGAALLFALYLIDPRVKTLTQILPAEYTTVVDADKACGVADFAALLKANGAKRVLLAAPVADAELAAFAEKLSAYLTAAGSKVKSVTFTAESNEWFHYFDTPAEEADFHLYLCENTARGVLSLVSKNADATAFFADRKSARTKVLCGALDAMSGSEYLCTVMHGKSLAFLD